MLDFCNFTAILASIYALASGVADPAPLAVAVSSAHPKVTAMYPFGPHNDHWDITRDSDSKWIYMNPKNGKHEQTVIFLHGYSGSSEDFYEGFAGYLEAPTNTRIILPQA